MSKVSSDPLTPLSTNKLGQTVTYEIERKTLALVFLLANLSSTKTFHTWRHCPVKNKDKSALQAAWNRC